MATTRGIMKQELKRATGNVEWAINHLARVIIVYKDDHPEIALPLIEAVEALEKVNELVNTVEQSI